MADNLSMALAELLRKAHAEPDVDTLREGGARHDPSVDVARSRPASGRGALSTQSGSTG